MRKVYLLISESSDSSSNRGDFYGWVTWNESNPFSGERRYRCNYIGNIKEGDKVTLYSKHDKSKIYKGSVTGIERHSAGEDAKIEKEKNDDITLIIKPDNLFKNLGPLNDVALISNNHNIEYTNYIKCNFSGLTGSIEKLKHDLSWMIYLIPLTKYTGAHHYEFQFNGKIKEFEYKSDDNGMGKGTMGVQFSKFCPIIKGMKFIISNNPKSFTLKMLSREGHTSIICEVI